MAVIKLHLDDSRWNTNSHWHLVFATVPSIWNRSEWGLIARLSPSKSNGEKAQSVSGWIGTDRKDGHRWRDLCAHNKNYMKIISFTILTVKQNLWASVPSILFVILFLKRLRPLHKDFIHSEACITLSGLIWCSQKIYNNCPLTVNDSWHSPSWGRRETDGLGAIWLPWWYLRRVARDGHQTGQLRTL